MQTVCQTGQAGSSEPGQGKALPGSGRKQWERAGQYAFLSPSSRLSACPELGNDVCSADMISGWFQLPNTVPHHHPLHTGIWAAVVGRHLGGGQRSGLCPPATPLPPPPHTGLH